MLKVVLLIGLSSLMNFSPQLMLKFRLCMRCIVPYRSYQDYKTHYLSGCDIYVIRLMRDGSLGMSKPCQTCLTMIQKMGIRRVYYSDANGDIKMELASEMTSEHICSGERFS